MPIYRIEKIAISLGCAVVLTVLAACGGRPSAAPTTVKQATPSAAVAAAAAGATSTSARSTATSAATAAARANTPTPAPTAAAKSSATPAAPAADSVAEAMAKNDKPHDDAASYRLDATKVTQIVLSGNAIQADGPGVKVEGGKATITAAGTYSIRGSLADGQIIVNTQDKEPVKLVLSGVTLSSSTSAPIYVMEAKETVIVLADASENRVSDGASYTFAVPADEEPNAAIFSKSDLTIYGGGSLTVAGNFNDGIASKDGLVIAGGKITVNAVDDGIRGRDYLVIRDGQITVSAKGDGLKSDNVEDPTRGYISVEKGVIKITAGGDAFDAETDVTIAAGTITLASGGGSKGRVADNTSAKGIKGAVSVVIDDGAFSIDTADDAIHANGSIVINGGAFVMATGDDGVHADATVKINGGDIRITNCYEGIESAIITINGGNIHLVSSDDGLNVAAGRDGSGTIAPQGPGARPGRGAGPGQDTFTGTGDYYLSINGGYTAIEATGDGIDINGTVVMTDGVLIVHGPTQQMNGALDYDGSFKMTGGFLVAVGSAGMAQAPGASSTQNALLLNFNGALQAGVLIHIQTSAGKEVLTFAPKKQTQSIAFSSPALVNGSAYEVYYGGSSTGTVQDGLYQGGKYSAGTRYTSFTVSSVVTAIGAQRVR